MLTARRPGVETAIKRISEWGSDVSSARLRRRAENKCRQSDTWNKMKHSSMLLYAEKLLKGCFCFAAALR